MIFTLLLLFKGGAPSGVLQHIMAPGLEYRAPESRFDYRTPKDSRFDYRSPESKLDYRAPNKT